MYISVLNIINHYIININTLSTTIYVNKGISVLISL